MRILMVNKYLYPRGGAETYFLKIGSHLQEIGHEVEYFGMSDEKNTVFNSANEYTSNMDFHKGSIKAFLYPFQIIYSFEAKRKIKKVIENYHPDIVHLNNINYQLTPSVIEEIHAHNIPIVQTVHDYQMLCPNHLFLNIHTLQPCELCLQGSTWNCAKKNCIHDSKIKSIIGSIEAAVYKKRRTYELVDQYICLSNFLEKKLLHQAQFKGKTLTIHNFIDQKEMTGKPEKEDYVLFFGRLSEEKGFELFVECCKKLPHIKFVVAGTGPLEKLCKDVPNIEYIGFVTGEELSYVIKKAMFSVCPSVCHENCPLSVLESESLGTPVVATRMGGIPELIEQDETGILLKDNRVETLREAISDLYDDSEKLTRMSLNCIAKRAQMISLEKYSNKMIELYENYKR